MFDHRFNSTTAALAAVADGVEAVQHSILAPDRVQAAALVLGFQELESIPLSEPATCLGMVLQGEIHEGLPNDHAHLDWLAGVIPNLTATALENGHVVIPFQKAKTDYG